MKEMGGPRSFRRCNYNENTRGHVGQFHFFSFKVAQSNFLWQRGLIVCLIN